jgi:MarR family transcriptional regulator, organic hydroperoxide resistance regulator
MTVVATATEISSDPAGVSLATGAPAAAEAPAAGSLAAEAWSELRAVLSQQRRRFLGAASELDLHPAQAGALLQLTSPLPMNELAAMLACDNSNVTGLVDRLAARGLVARQASPDDRRVKHIVLTPAGSRLREQLLERVGRPPAGFARLAPAEQRQLRDLLRRVQ